MVDKGLGRVALRSTHSRPADTFQWIETFTGDLTSMSLTTHRYLRLDWKLHGKDPQ